MQNIKTRRAAMIAAGDWRDQTLLDHLRHVVASTPDKPAIIAIRNGDEHHIDYRTLDRLSDRVAANLRARGVQPGDTVSFQLPNWWEFSVLHLACLKAGAVSNPLMIIFRERELAFMLALADAKILIVPTGFRGFDYPAMVSNVRAKLPALRHVFAIGDATLRRDNQRENARQSR